MAVICLEKIRGVRISLLRMYSTYSDVSPESLLGWYSGATSKGVYSTAVRLFFNEPKVPRRQRPALTSPREVGN